MIFDPLYIVIILVSLALSGFASMMVKSKFKKGSKIRIASGLSGRDVAKRVLESAGISDVNIIKNDGFLSDYYNPMTKTLALSPEVHDGYSASSAGVAAHEAGHAIQHAESYNPLWLRATILPVANIGSNLGPWLVIIGILVGVGSSIGHIFAVAGVYLFAAATLFTLITVPVEFDASRRAKERLVGSGIIDTGREYEAVDGVLTAAGWTYVAAAISSIMMLIYWAMRAGLLGSDE